MILPNVLLSNREYSPAFLTAPDKETELTLLPLREFTTTLSPFLRTNDEISFGLIIVVCPVDRILSTEILDISAKGVTPRAKLSTSSSELFSTIS